MGAILPRPPPSVPMSSPFWLCTVASGSSGNCAYAECPEGALLIDAGISGRRIATQIADVGGGIERVVGLVVTHGHVDHARSAGVLARRHGIELYMTQGTYDAARSGLGEEQPVLFQPGAELSIGGFTVHTLATPHDARGSVAVVLERAGLRAGVLTDLGHPFEELGRVMTGLDAVVLEANYDPAMLEEGSYPARLKRRIRSPRGHLANEQAAELLRLHGSDRLQAVLLAHLSENNNEPGLALETVRALAQSRLRSSGAWLDAAPRHAPSRIIELRLP